MKKLQFENNLPTILLTLKVVVVLVLLAFPFIPSTTLTTFDTMGVKILFLLLIVVTCFIDFQLSLLLTIAFLLFVIHANSASLSKIQSKKQQIKDTFVNTNKPSEATNQLQTYFVQPQVPHVKDHTKNIVCTPPKLNDINKDLLNIYVDEKIKPYEVYVAMMTNEEQLAKAQGEFI